MDKIAPRMTKEEADQWYRNLMVWISKNHPHLEVKINLLEYSRYLTTPYEK